MSLPTQNKRVVKEEKEISCESATPLFIYTIYMSYAHHRITTHMTYELMERMHVVEFNGKTYLFFISRLYAKIVDDTNTNIESFIIYTGIVQYIG